MNTFDMTFNNNNIWDNVSWNNAAPTYNAGWNSGIGDSFTFTNKNKANFSVKDYNANAGERLARYALSHKARSFTGNCAKYVKNAIQACGLGAYKSGHGYQMAGILRKNSHFKEISPNSVNVKDLPAGCIIVFDRGMYKYSDDYGHVEITTGDGRGVSDGVTTDLRKPSAIFVPV